MWNRTKNWEEKHSTTSPETTCHVEEDTVPKKAWKVLNKKERENLLRFLSSIDDQTLLNAAIMRLNDAQFLNVKLKIFAGGLCENKLLQEI